jgi:hypothetical protein
MPYSRDPRNFPPFFTELINSFTAAPDVVQFTLANKKDATRTRIMFYSFIRALECEVVKLRKLGQVSEATGHTQLAALGRTRLIEIYPTPGDLNETWDMSFTRRDYQDSIAAMREQFDNMGIKPPPSPDTAWVDDAIIDEFNRGAFDADAGTDLDGLLVERVDEKS